MSKEDYDLTFRNFFIGPIESLITKLKTKAYNLNHHNDNNYIVNNDRTRQVAKALLDSWSAMKMLADKNNALFVAALQPNVAIGHPNVKYLEIDSGFVEPYKYLYPEILRQINDTAYEDIKNNFIDLTAIFDVEDSLYIDWCHVIPEGNKIIAEKLLEYINNIVNN